MSTAKNVSKIQFLFLLVICSGTINGQNQHILELNPVTFQFDLTCPINDGFRLFNSSQEFSDYNCLDSVGEIDFSTSSALFISYNLPDYKSNMKVELFKNEGEELYTLKITIFKGEKIISPAVTSLQMFSTTKISSKESIKVKVIEKN